MKAMSRLALAACSIVLSLGFGAAPGLAATGEEIGALPTLDPLNRSEAPLSHDGRWTALNWAAAAGQDTAGGWGPSHAFPNVNGAYWSAAEIEGRFGNAAALTMQTPPGIAERYVSIWLNMPSPGQAKSGYQLRWTVNTDTSTYAVKLSKWEAGAETELAANPSVSIPPGTTMAIADTGGTVSAWRTENGSLIPLLSAADVAYADGYAGIEASGNISRSIDFKAGPLLAGAVRAAPVQDDLQRREVPLKTGKWTKAPWAGQMGGAWMDDYRGYGSSGGLAGAFWNPAPASDEKGGVLVAGTVGTGALPAGHYLGLWLNMPDPGSARSGYEARFTGTNGSADAYKVEISKWVAGARTVLARRGGFSLPVGTTMALTESRGSIVLWTGSSTLTPVLSAHDASYAGGYAGLTVNGASGTIYDFRAGSLAQPPETAITFGSRGTILSDGAFAFTATEPGATFECAIDEGEFSACGSPKIYSGIPAGAYRFKVRAIGEEGPDLTPVERAVQVIAPATAIEKVPQRDDLERSEVPLASAGWTKTAWAGNIGGTWMDGFRGYGSSGGVAGAFWNPATFDDSAGAVISAATVGTGAAPAGQYLGLWLNMPNPGSARSGYEARFTGTDGSADAYRVELSKWVAGTRTVLASREGFSLAVGTRMLLSETGGNVTLRTGTSAFSQVLSAYDTTYSAGYAGLEVNGGSGTLYRFRAGNIDATAPETTISAGPSGLVLPQEVSFAFASSESGASFECSLDGGAFEACASPKAYPSIGYGAHTFRVRARDGAGNADATPAESAFTVISPPTVTTKPASGVRDTEAVLNADVNPNNSATTYRFEWGTSGSYGNVVPASAQSVGSGVGVVEVSEPLADLSPDTEYHFRISATNGNGTSHGADMTFTTANAPQATTDAAAEVSAHEATLRARVNPHGAPTTYYFEYGPTPAYGSKAPATPAEAGSGRAEIVVSEAVSGLSEGSEYHFRIVADNQIGTSHGADQSFTTPFLPDADTSEANEVTANEAVLMGTVDPNGEPTSYRFQYGTTTAYGNTVPAVSEEMETGSQPVDAEEGIAFLEPETTYHYRLIATSAAGTVVGPDQTLTTAARTQTPAQEAQQAQAEANGAPVPGDFVNIHWSGDTPRYATEAVMEMVRGSGAKMLRMGVGRRSETYDWIFRRAAQRGITLLPGLGGNRMEDENSDGIRPGWRDHVRAVVQAYGRGGEFWQTVDAGSRRPPVYWEIWNEQNYGNNGDSSGHPNPAAYGDLLQEAANVIHEVDPQAKILLGGLLTVGRKGDVPKMKVGEFIRKMTHHGAYDALGLHPYVFKDDEGNAPTDESDVKEVTEAVRRNIQEARAALNDKGGADKKIWVNEIGWPVKGPITPNDGTHVPVSEEMQKDLLNATFNMIKANRGPDRFNIENVFYYNLQDYEESDPNIDHHAWDYRSGLREELKPYENGRYRKAWYAFQQQAGFTGTYPKPARNDHELRSERPRKLVEFTKMNPYGSPTEYWVKWGPGWNSNTYGNFTTARSFGDRVEEADVTKESVVAGLQPSTKYHYAVVSENDAGQKTETADMQFETPPSSSTSNNVERVLHGQPGWVWVEGWVKEGDIQGPLPGLSNVHVHIKLFRNGQFERLVDVMTDANGHYDSGYIQVGKGTWETRTDFPGGGGWDPSSSSVKTFRVQDGVLIRARHSDNCMDVEGGWFANGVRVMHGGCHAEANQVFTLRPRGNGEILEIVARHSGKCLDVGWASHNDGEQIVQHDCNGGANQGFREAWWADTPYTSYVAQHSGKCLDVAGGSTGWAPIQQWTCNGVLQQRFRLAPVESGPIPTETSVEIDQVLHGSPGMVSFHGYLKAGPYSMANRVVQVEFDNAAAGGWSTMYSVGVGVNSGGYYEYRDYGVPPGHYNIRARFAGNGEFKESFSPGVHARTVKRGYHIVNRYSNQCLTLSENRNQNGAAFIQWPCVGAVNGNGQVFSFWPQGNGWYEIKVNGTNRCMDVAGVNPNNDAHIQLWDCLGAGQHNQHWDREPIAGQAPWYALIARHSNRCASNFHWSTAAGSRVIQWDCVWAGNQQWALNGVIDP